MKSFFLFQMLRILGNAIINRVFLHFDSFHMIDGLWLSNFDLFQQEETTMINSTKFLVSAALISVLLMSFFTESESSPSPGHLVHDFYKCQSEYFKAFFKRCKRNLPNHNSAPTSNSAASKLVMMLAVGLSFVFSRT